MLQIVHTVANEITVSCIRSDKSEELVKTFARVDGHIYTPTHFDPEEGLMVDKLTIEYIHVYF